MRVALGGTFDRIHKGHKAIFERAFALGDEVLIGVTSDEMARKARGYSVRPLVTRMKNLREFLQASGYRRFEIVRIDDVYGPAPHTQALDAIIVSEATKDTAEEINKMREENGLKSLEIHVVPIVLADDSCPISSTRIRSGEIDEEGKLLRVVVVNIGSKNKAKIWGARDAFLMVFEKVEIHSVEVKSKVSKNPTEDEVVEGAVLRAREAIGGADFGVGIESGLFQDDEMGGKKLVQYCAIVDKRDVITLGQGAGFMLPKPITEAILADLPLNEAVRNYLNLEEIDEERGCVGYLSRGLTSRRELTKQAVLMAFLPRLRSEAYPELWRQNP